MVGTEDDNLRLLPDSPCIDAGDNSAILGGNWLVATLLTLGFYILWLYYRLVKLENWISRGTKASQVYDDDGFIGIIIRQLYQQKKQ